MGKFNSGICIQNNVMCKCILILSSCQLPFFRFQFFQDQKRLHNPTSDVLDIDYNSRSSWNHATYLLSLDLSTLCKSSQGHNKTEDVCLHKWTNWQPDFHLVPWMLFLDFKESVIHIEICTRVKRDKKSVWKAIMLYS